jgi:type IV fimbrial biogenesis protein FimT
MNTKHHHLQLKPVCDRAPPRRRVQGFTIIELMITLTVAAILLAIAIPSFTYLTVSSKLTTTANDLVNALGTARSEAVKRNAVLCVNQTSSNAAGSISLPTLPAGTCPLVVNLPLISAAIPVQTPVISLNIPAALTATPMGMIVSGGTAGFTGLAADVSSTQISSNNHRCVYVTTGTTISSCTSSAACQAGTPNANCK